MDKRVYPVDAGYQVWSLKEEVLDGHLPEHPQLLFDVDQLQCVFASNVNGFVLQRQCRERPSELVSLVSHGISFLVIPRGG